MGLWTSLATAFLPRATLPGPWDDFWYRPVPMLSNFGTYISADSALRTSAVWACVNILSKTLAQLPVFVYRRRADGGKDEDSSHPVWRIFRRKPNAWQSAFEFKQFGMSCLLLRGNFYCQKRYDRVGALEQLVPIHPDRVRVEQLSTGRLGYLVRDAGGVETAITQDDMFHVRGLTLDGITGLSPISYAAETIGRSMAQETYAANFYRNSMEASHVITGPKLLSKPAREALKADVEERSGYRNAGKTLLLEEGFTLQQLSLTARDSQFIEGSYATIEDVCRWFDVPPNIIHHLLRSTFSNAEQESLNYVSLHFLPWPAAWESAAQRDLFDEDNEGEHVLTFNVDALLRGSAADRAAAEAIWIQNGVMSENEVRLKENLNPVEGLWEPRRSVNQDRGEEPRTDDEAEPPALEDDEDEDDDEEEAARSIVMRVAARLVRREISAVRRQHARGRLDAAWVTDFYAHHVAMLTESLCLTAEVSRHYGLAHCDALLQQGIAVLAEWEQHEPIRLAALALRQENGHG